MDEVVWDYQLIHRLADTPDSSANEDLDEELGEEGDLEVEDNAGDVEEEMEALFVVVKNEIVAKLAEVVERFEKRFCQLKVLLFRALMPPEPIRLVLASVK